MGWKRVSNIPIFQITYTHTPLNPQMYFYGGKINLDTNEVIYKNRKMVRDQGLTK
jgi:hypothetical protein